MAETAAIPVLEIKNEFVICELCLEYFDDAGRMLHLLPCDHTFCYQCLEALWQKSAQDITCPNCQKAWPVENSTQATFPKNKTVCNLVEYIALKNNPEKVMCKKCPNSSVATLYCLDCSQPMCEFCSEFHKNFTLLQHHKTFPISELSESDFFHHRGICEQHSNMKKDIFCKTCSLAACSSCILVEHLNHTLSKSNDVYDEHKKRIKTALSDLLESRKQCAAYREKLNEEKNTLDKIQHDLSNEIDEMHKTIVNKICLVTTQMKEDVVYNVRKQKSDRDEQLEVVEKTEKLNDEHFLYCQKVFQFATETDLIQTSGRLENKIKSLSLSLPELQIENVDVDFKFLKRVERSLHRSATLCNVSRFRPYIQLSDVGKGQVSDVLAYTTLLEEDDDENIKIDAVIEPPGGNESAVKQTLPSVSAITGSFPFKPEVTGPHKISLTINGENLQEEQFVFHSRENESPKTRKLLCLQPEPASHRGIYREIFLTTMKFAEKTLNWEKCCVNENKELVNKRSVEKTQTEGKMKVIFGVTGDTYFRENKCYLWQSEITCQILKSKILNKVAAQIGVCVQGHCDEETGIGNNKHAWGVNFGSCGKHNKMCLVATSCSEGKCDSPVCD